MPLKETENPILANSNNSGSLVAILFDPTKVLSIWEVDEGSKEVKEKINTRIDLGTQSSFKPSDIYFSDDESKVGIYFVDNKRQAACLVEYSLADGKTTLT